MARVIFFDIGNVIVKFDYSVALQRLKAGCDRPDLPERPEFMALKWAYEGGQMGKQQFLQEARDLIGYRDSLEAFEKLWQEIFTLNEPMADLIGRIRDSRLLHISNISDLHHDYLWAKFPVFHRFEGGIYSYVIQKLKPDPDVFRVALETYELAPEEVLFVDDLEDNIEAARSVGLPSWHYHHEAHSAFERWLRENEVVIGQGSPAEETDLLS